MPANVYALTKLAVAHYEQLKTTPDILRFVGQQAYERPMALVELFALKALRSWYGNETQMHERLIAIIQICYFPFVICGLMLLKRGCKKERNLFYAILTIPLYFWIMTVLTALPIVRYQVPAASLLAIPVAAALEHVLFREPVGAGVKESVLVGP